MELESGREGGAVLMQYHPQWWDARCVVLAGVAWIIGSAVASASGPLFPAHLPASLRTGAVGELRVMANWEQRYPIVTLVRVDGVAGWRGRLFGPGGYESRLFCDEDNPAVVIARRPGSIVWATGNLWDGAGCEARLFFTANEPLRCRKSLPQVHELRL